MKRGFCPTTHRPMPSGDGLLVRIRPRAARLTTAQAHLLDEAAARWGNGLIELTGRGNLQCRGFSPASFPSFLRAMIEAGIVDGDPVADGRRRIIAAPLLADLATHDALESALGAEPAMDALPPKFALRLDGGPVSVATVPAEVDVTDVAGALARLRAPPPRTAAAGAPPVTIGAFPWGVGLAPLFAQFAPGDLSALADLAADGTIRVTPFRSVLLPGAAPTVLASAAARFIADPADPRLRIRACVGAPGCPSGQSPAREVAARFVRAVPPAGILHLSGCAKGCAHPAPAARLFVGRAGRLVEEVAA